MNSRARIQDRLQLPLVEHMRYLECVVVVVIIFATLKSQSSFPNPQSPPATKKNSLIFPFSLGQRPLLGTLQAPGLQVSFSGMAASGWLLSVSPGQYIVVFVLVLIVLHSIYANRLKLRTAAEAEAEAWNGMEWSQLDTHSYLNAK